MEEAVEPDSMIALRAKRLMKRVEEKVFDKHRSSLEIFRGFDRDNDGFVSYEDFSGYLKKLEIHASDKEVKGLLSVLDKEKKGFLDYQRFNERIHPFMS